MNGLMLAFGLALEVVSTNGTRSVETVEVTERDGVSSFRLTQAEIVAKGAKRIVLTPEFARAEKGEDGFWVVSTGQLGTFRCDEGKHVCDWPSMSMYGMKTPRRTFVAIVKGLKYYFHTEVTAKNGDYAMSCVLHDELCREPYEDFEIEFRGRPNFYFYSKFVDDGTDWMGKSDLGCATDEELRASVAKIKKGWDVWSKVSHLQYEFIENHEELDKDVFRTTWSDGTSITCNYSDEAYDGIPPSDWKITCKE